MNPILVNIKSHSLSIGDADFKHQSKQTEHIFLCLILFKYMPSLQGEFMLIMTS